jgi:hypothetical protein
MKRDLFRALVVLLATLAVIAVNGLANALPLDGVTTGAVSDSFEVLFTPAAYVFGIWGLIYLALLAYSVYQLLPGPRTSQTLRSISTLYLGTCLANVAWIFLWHYQRFPLTLIAMFALLACLVAIDRRLGTGRSAVSAAESWLVRVPFSIYLGWITVATVANVAVVLVYWGWGGWGLAPAVWTVIMMAVAAALGWIMSLRERNLAYNLVLAWALVGIAVRQAGQPLLVASAIVLAISVLAVWLWAALRARRPAAA